MQQDMIDGGEKGEEEGGGGAPPSVVGTAQYSPTYLQPLRQHLAAKITSNVYHLHVWYD